VPARIEGQDLRTWVDAATLQRGRDVWLQGRVIEAEVEQPSLDERLFRGVVMGSRDEEYLTDVSVSFDPRGRVCEFDGTCSCPMEVDCKHAVAWCWPASRAVSCPRLTPQSSPSWSLPMQNRDAS